MQIQCLSPVNNINNCYPKNNPLSNSTIQNTKSNLNPMNTLDCLASRNSLIFKGQVGLKESDRARAREISKEANGLHSKAEDLFKKFQNINRAFNREHAQTLYNLKTPDGEELFTQREKERKPDYPIVSVFSIEHPKEYKSDKELEELNNRLQYLSEESKVYSKNFKSLLICMVTSNICIIKKYSIKPPTIIKKVCKAVKLPINEFFKSELFDFNKLDD